MQFVANVKKSVNKNGGRRIKMASTKSPYKEMRISISKVLGWDKTTRKDPKKQKSKIMEVIESGKSPGVVGYKNGGKW